MAILYRKTQNKIGKTSGYGKWYPKTVLAGTVGTEQLAEEISHSTSLTLADIMGVLIELGVVMRRHMLDSQKVSLYRIGSFRVGIKSVPADNKADCDASRIKGYRIIYSPETTFNATGVSDRGFPTGFYAKDLLAGITAREVPSGGEADG